MLPHERIALLDVLRGFAIFGIVLVNWNPWDGYIRGGIDHVALRFLECFVSGKFYTLFSFLFGLGLSIQMARAEWRGVAFLRVYRRRLFALLLIGVGHFMLLWYGDILHIYAVLGFLLLLFRHRSPKTLLVWAVLSLAAAILLPGIVFRGWPLQRADPEMSQALGLEAAGRGIEQQTFWAQGRQAVSQGTYSEMVAHRARDFSRGVRLFWILDGSIFAMFLVGLYAGRRGIFQSIPAHLPFIRKVMWWGLGIGLLGNLARVALLELSARALYSPSFPVQFPLFQVSAPALCLFYCAAITLLFQRQKWEKRLAPLAWVGRMALTNYLLQTLIFTTLQYNYGLGLFGKLGDALTIVLATTVYLLQIPLSMWWLRRFQFGPMEWLWRSLTYGQLPPMRLQDARPAEEPTSVTAPA